MLRKIGVMETGRDTTGPAGGPSGGITGVILAGGRARRMGGADKGLQPLRGSALVDRVLAHLAPQVDEILIVANRSLDAYRSRGYRVVSDELPDFAGPLAGLQAAYRAARHAWILTVPCDAPFLPLDLCARLKEALAGGRTCAVAACSGRRQPVFSLSSRSLAPRLDGYLAAGGRALHAWQVSVEAVEAAFDDRAEAFAPVNTLQALSSLSAQER